MSDEMRYNLVLQAKCARCGNKLVFSYETPKPRDSQLGTDDGIAGAYKVEHGFTVWPCEKCYSEASESGRMLAAAMSAANKAWGTT